MNHIILSLLLICSLAGLAFGQSASKPDELPNNVSNILQSRKASGIVVISQPALADDSTQADDPSAQTSMEPPLPTSSNPATAAEQTKANTGDPEASQVGDSPQATDSASAQAVTQSSFAPQAAIAPTITPASASSEEAEQAVAEPLQKTHGNLTEEDINQIMGTKVYWASVEDVYNLANILVTDIHLLRDRLKVNNEPRTPGVQFGKTPLHAYGKGLEVLAKLSNIQKSLGMQAVEVPKMPLKQYQDSNVYEMVVQLVLEFGRVKQHFQVNERPQIPEPQTKKNPSDVYEILWQASYLLDGIGQSWTPSDVYRNNLIILDELRSMEAFFENEVRTDYEVTVAEEITPEDVLIETYKNLYRLARIHITVGIPPFNPPPFPSGDIIPSDPYDATSTIISEMVRIRFFLAIANDTPLPPAVVEKSTKDVYVQTVIIGKNLESFILSAQ